MFFLPSGHSILLPIVLTGARLFAADFKFRGDAEKLVLGYLARDWLSVVSWTRIFQMLIRTGNQGAVISTIGPEIA